MTGPKPSTRRERLAAALRANLKRRKAQARARTQDRERRAGPAQSSAGIVADKKP